MLLATVLMLSGLLATTPAWAEDAREQAAASESTEPTEPDEGQPPAEQADDAPALPGEGQMNDEPTAAEPDAETEPAVEDDVSELPAAEDAVVEPLTLSPLTAVSGGWIKAYGGNLTDVFLGVAPTSDGGFVAVGYSFSSNGDVSKNRGSGDFVIARFDANGNKLWLKTYGGNDYDVFRSVIVARDGSIVAVGESNSSNGDLEGKNSGYEEAVIAKFDANGNKLWLNTYGQHYGREGFYSVIQASDGSFVAVGDTRYYTFPPSPNPVPSESWNNGQAVIAKFNADGSRAWLTLCGGSWEPDFFYSVIQVSDGGFVAVGNTRYTSGPAINNPDILASDALESVYPDPYNDFFVARFDANGNELWLKAYGGTDVSPNGDIFWSVAPTLDGGFVAVGEAVANDGDLPGNKGSFDAVVARFDADGNKVWLKNYGGTEYDSFCSVIPLADGTFVAVGGSRSPNGDFPSNKGYYDWLIVRIGANGEILSFKNYGGRSNDSVCAAALATDGRLIVVGDSDSSGGDIGGERISYDFLVAKFDLQDLVGPTFSQPPDTSFDGAVVTIASKLAPSRVLDVTGGSTADRARIQLYQANTTPAQRFRMERVAGTDYYVIKNVSSGKVLDVANGKAFSGAAVQQYKDNGSNAQRWKLFSALDGGHILVSALNESMALDLPAAASASGTKLQLYTANGTAAQRFSMNRIDVPTGLVSGGTYFIASTLDAGGDKVADVAGGSTANRANVWLYQKNSTDAQKFRLTYDSATGYWVVANASSGKVLDVAGGGSARGTNVWMYQSNNTWAQRWTIVPGGAPDSYVLYAACSGLVLDVAGGKTASGTNIQTYTPNGSPAQAWSFKAA
jgi:hypothetical protein